MAQRFTTYLRQRAAPIWDRIFQHPFLQEVSAGTLPVESFRYYLTQDYHYMGAFGRAVAIAVAKAPDNSTFERLGHRLTTPVERPLHRRLFALVDMDPETVEAASLSPTNTAYINHLLATAFTGDVGLIAAALLPCPWTYHELGNHVPATGHLLYDTWSAFYREGGLRESVATWREVADHMAQGRDTIYRRLLEQAFLTSSRYEYLFWEMAYRMEEWPV